MKFKTSSSIAYGAKFKRGAVSAANSGHHYYAYEIMLKTKWKATYGATWKETQNKVHKRLMPMVLNEMKLWAEYKAERKSNNEQNIADLKLLYKGK